MLEEKIFIGERFVLVDVPARRSRSRHDAVGQLMQNLIVYLRPKWRRQWAMISSISISCAVIPASCCRQEEQEITRDRKIVFFGVISRIFVLRSQMMSPGECLQDLASKFS